jgi:branched-chain amino acid transport system substrate-binding protein
MVNLNSIQQSSKRGLFFLFLLTGCLFASADSANAQQTIKIGWTGPLTGNSAVLGVDSVQAVRLAIDEANTKGGIRGQKLELLVEDDQYDTAKAVSAYSKLVSQGARAIIASTYGGVVATADRAVKDEVVIINPLDCNNKIAALSGNTFCIATESESVARAIGGDIRKTDLTPVLTLFDEKNPFMELVQETLKQSLSESSKSLFIGLDMAAPDFRSVLLKAKSLGIKSIVFLGHDPMGQAMREARSLGINAQFYTVGTITSPGFQSLADKAADGTKVAYWEAPRGPALSTFLKDFEAKAGRPPILELATIPSYDAAKVLLLAITQATLRSKTTMKGEFVRLLKESLYGVKDFSGLSGAISMDADGAVRSIKEAMYTYNGGKLTRIESEGKE